MVQCGSELILQLGGCGLCYRVLAELESVADSLNCAAHSLFG